MAFSHTHVVQLPSSELRGYIIYKMQIADFKNIFDLTYLNTNPTQPMKSAFFLLIFFVLCLIFGVVYSVIVEKRTNPRFIKKFQRRVADFFIYIPVASILLVLAHMGLIPTISKPIVLVLTMIIWLIWLLFLIYYRLFVVSKLWKKYKHHRRQEGYLKHGEDSNQK
jgi:Na+/glutamate symporter